MPPAVVWRPLLYKIENCCGGRLVIHFASLSSRLKLITFNSYNAVKVC